MKTKKIIFILITTIIFLLLFIPNSFATVTSFENMWNTAFQNPTMPTKVTKIAGIIIAFLRNVSIIITVIIITLLGLKYMLGSVEEKADYKKSFPNVIIGAVMISGIFSIVSAIFSLAGI